MHDDNPPISNDAAAVNLTEGSVFMALNRSKNVFIGVVTAVLTTEIHYYYFTGKGKGRKTRTALKWAQYDSTHDKFYLGWAMDYWD
jgi:hypothetical protein